MADQAELIRQQMDETRSSMTEKIEALEKQVSETVKDTTETVAETVQTASETVDKTLETISETVETVTDTFNIPAHISNHPWMAMGTSVVLGFLLGSMIPPRRRWQHATIPVPPPEPTPPAPQPAARSAEPDGPDQPTESTEVREDEKPRSTTVADIFGSLKSLAVGTAVGVFGKSLLNSVPQDLRSGLSGILEELTENLGGSKPQR